MLQDERGLRRPTAALLHPCTSNMQPSR
jgi:hypothetical protein